MARAGIHGGGGVGATLLSGLAPALGLRGVEANEALKEQGRSVAGDCRLGLRNALVVRQVAVSFALVAGAGLFVRTFSTLVTTPLGFDPAGLLVVSVDAAAQSVPHSGPDSSSRRVADAASTCPASRARRCHSDADERPRLDPPGARRGRADRAPAQQVTSVNAVAPGWFETYGMRLVAGRDFAAAD